MSLSTPIDSESIATVCAMRHHPKEQCKAAHKLFFEHADALAKEHKNKSPFNRNLKVLGFHFSKPALDAGGNPTIVKCGNNGCGSLTLFEVEELYIIRGANGGSLRLRVAKTSAGAIASFSIMMAVLGILLILLVVWGVQSSKRNRVTHHNNSS
jgi:hypothetical protein